MVAKRRKDAGKDAENGEKKKKKKKKKRSVDHGAKKEPNPTHFLQWMKRRDSNGATMGFCDRH